MVVFVQFFLMKPESPRAGPRLFISQNFLIQETLAIGTAFSTMQVDAGAYYATYHGHDVAHLSAVRSLLRSAGARQFIYLAGDSSLDNKYWLSHEQLVSASAGMEAALSSPAGSVRVPPDIAALICARLRARLGAGWACLNAAVEESTLASRHADRALPPQDAWLAGVLTTEDVLVCSAGGNDVVLAPSVATVAALATLLLTASEAGLRNGTAFGMGTVERLFRDDVEAWLARLCARTAPKLVLVLFPYFPHEGGAGWADAALALMGYGTNPQRLQAVMRAVFARATRSVRAPGGTRVVPIALFDVLDAAPASADYVARVEPSATGGAKIADAILDAVAADLADGEQQRRGSA